MSGDFFIDLFREPWFYVITALYVSIAVFCVWFIKGYKRRMALWRARRERQRTLRNKNRRQHQVGVEWYEDPMFDLASTPEKAAPKKPKNKSKRNNDPEERVHTADIRVTNPQIATSGQL